MQQKSKTLISCTVTPQLIYAFVFAYAKSRFSHVAALTYVLNNDIKNQKSSFVCLLVLSEALCPSQQFFSDVRTEPLVPGYYQYFFGR